MIILLARLVRPHLTQFIGFLKNAPLPIGQWSLSYRLALKWMAKVQIIDCELIMHLMIERKKLIVKRELTTRTIDLHQMALQSGADEPSEELFVSSIRPSASTVGTNIPGCCSSCSCSLLTTSKLPLLFPLIVVFQVHYALVTQK